jgi:NAD(P)H-dependent flavin oxidoreductase YrpB (nitropropane dioxygenase family)
MGGSDLTELAASVAECGGLGGLGITWSSEDDVRDQVKRVRAKTKRPFAVGYVLAFPPTTLAAALEEGAPVVQFSWGIPSSEDVKLVRSYGAHMGVQVSNLDGARRALDVGADYISVQGQEAGGHIQASASWHQNLGPAVREAGETPVLVAGGLGDGRSLRVALNAGAAGGVFGTRFVACKENQFHQHYKERLVQSTANDSMLTVCFDGSWPNALHRVLRNKATNAWEAAGSGPAGSRPGDGDTVAVIGNTPLPRYTMYPPNEGMPASVVSEMALYAGLGVDLIHDVPSATDLVKRLWSECIQKHV